MRAVTSALWSLAMILLLGVGLAACGSEGAGSEARISQDAGPSSRPLAPDFSISTGPGSTFALADHKGEVVVLYFGSPG